MNSGNIGHVFHIEDVLDDAFYINLQNLWAPIFIEHVGIQLSLPSYWKYIQNSCKLHV